MREGGVSILLIVSQNSFFLILNEGFHKVMKSSKMSNQLQLEAGWVLSKIKIQTDSGNVRTDRNIMYLQANINSISLLDLALSPPLLLLLLLALPPLPLAGAHVVVVVVVVVVALLVLLWSCSGDPILKMDVQ